MTYQEFQRQIGKAGLTICQFAELIKMNRASISNYAQKGTVPSHLAVISVLLGEMAEHQINFHEILSKIEISRKKPRGSGFGN